VPPAERLAPFDPRPVRDVKASQWFGKLDGDMAFDRS
jgi:hypothetical protein